MKRDEAQLSDIPDAPGVYFFKQGTKTLYVGKATSLKSRVTSYFDGQLEAKRGPVVAKAVHDATHVEWEVTDSVLEALLLEARYIKALQPYGNKAEKDDKSFNYVVITHEPLPRLVVVRGRELSAKFAPAQRKYTFGPFTHGSALKEALAIIRRIFPYFDEKSTEKTTRRFNQEIGAYPEDDRRAYLATIRHIVLLFQGKKRALMRELERTMVRAARAERFEEAAKAKRQLFSLTHIRDTALLKDEYRVPHATEFRIEAFDTAHLAGESARGVMVVVENGEPVLSEYRTFTIRTAKGGDDYQALREVLERRFKHREWTFPKLIVVDGGRAHLKVAKLVMARCHPAIEVCAVVKDERHKPKQILGKKSFVSGHEKSILLANAEAHRFSLGRHRRALRKKVQ